jgi:hypothetical protein
MQPRQKQQTPPCCEPQEERKCSGAMIGKEPRPGRPIMFPMQRWPQYTPNSPVVIITNPQRDEPKDADAYAILGQ